MASSVIVKHRVICGNLRISSSTHSITLSTNCFPMKTMASCTDNSTKQPPGVHSSCRQPRNLQMIQK